MADAVVVDRRRTLHPTLRFVASRFGWGVLTLFVLSTLTFLATNFRSPRETARAMLGRGASEEQLDVFVTEQGLDEPLLTRFFDWLGDILVGNWGASPRTDEGVLEQILPRLTNTAMMAVLALVVSLAIAVPLGCYMARRVGKRDDFVLLIGTVVLAALPEFVVGIVLILVFGAMLSWLPVNSTALNFGTGPEIALAYVLPCATLTLAVVPYVARLTRAGVRDALASPAVQSATLRGLKPARIWIRHTLRLAAMPLINALLVSSTYLLGGVLVVENVFGFPGMGQLTVDAVAQGDTVLLQGCIIVLGGVVVVVSFLADLASLRFNPKLRGHTS